MAIVTTLVLMGEIQVFKGPARFTCLGLGSCVGVCAFDPYIGVAGMTHVVLPATFDAAPGLPGRFADQAVREMVAMMERLGAVRGRLLVAFAGGAQVLDRKGEGKGLDIGGRNVVAVREQIDALGLCCLSEDCGGTRARTMVLDAETGRVTVRALAGGERLLCNLRGKAA